ncbi:hypothetical protein T4E_1971 [Trichinella pseudospiralis]|uniref:Uncharacterized protein n=1 Tax=Trichinella pseudospiralis TaxID=6337 RepID=A0A0V0XFH9_TRIPS|nr:hypothetical protein T4E_1971 [Trichinella pseudospiralis]
MDGRLQGVFPPSYFNSHSSYDLIRPSCYCITGVPCLLPFVEKGGSSAAAAWGIAVLEFKITPLGRTSDTLGINLPRPLSAGASSNGGSVSTRLSPLPDGHHWIVVDDLQDFRVALPKNDRQQYGVCCVRDLPRVTYSPILQGYPAALASWTPYPETAFRSQLWPCLLLHRFLNPHALKAFLLATFDEAG